MADPFEFAEVGIEPETPPGELPYRLPLELTVEDADTIAALCQYAEGEEREQRHSSL